MKRLYQIHEFAELAGTTVKALHHYDRLGLLQPRRTEAGYRMYSTEDLERLEQIIALKFLGLSLQQIKAVLEQAPLALGDALRLQRRVLEEKQRLLARAIHAIGEAEKSLEPGKPADPAVLRRIVEVIGMRGGIHEMKRYFRTAPSWEKARRLYEEWPSQAWKDLYREIEHALEENPAGSRGQALAVRWMELLEKETAGDAAFRMGINHAWHDHDYWPEALRERLATFPMKQIRAFIDAALGACRRLRFTDEDLAAVIGLTRDGSGAAWYDLFLEITAAIDEDPAGQHAQTLAARWWTMDRGGENIRALLDRYRDLSAGTVGGEMIHRQLVLYHLERMSLFVLRASYIRTKWYDEFFRDVESALGEDPSGTKGQALAARWVEMNGRARQEAAKARFLEACPTLQHHAAFAKVTNFIDRSLR